MNFTIELNYRPPDERWFWAPLAIGSDVTLRMILDPLFPVSVISDGSLRDTLAMEKVGSDQLVQTTGRNRYKLLKLKLKGQAIPDLDVRTTTILGRISNMLGADGIIGFDFFRASATICFDVDSGTLSMTGTSSTGHSSQATI